MVTLVSAESSVAPTKRMGMAAEVAEELKARDNFLIVSHVRPDGDCLGSATALLMALRKIGKRVACYNPSKVGDKLHFIPMVGEIKDEMPAWTVDTTLFVDCGGPGRVTKTFRPTGFVINIDHHATNEVFGDLNYIDIKATAVGEQIYDIIGELGVELTAEMATSIYVSMAADSGSFRYPNTTARTFDVAAILTRAGANPARICRDLYESKSREEIILTGKALNRLHFECDGRLIWSELYWKDYEEVGGEDFEPEGLVSDIRCIDGVEVSILFHELQNGGIRAGFRGKGEVDCAWIAVQAGGGGHFNASGCYNENVRYEVERERILALAKAKVISSMNGK